jgi:hypothetical protein
MKIIVHNFPSDVDTQTRRNLVCYGTRNFIPLFMVFRHWNVTWTSLIQYITSRYVYLNQCLYYSSSAPTILLGIPPKNIVHISYCLIRTTCPVHLKLFHLTFLATWDKYTLWNFILLILYFLHLIRGYTLVCLRTLLCNTAKFFLSLCLRSYILTLKHSNI